MVWHLFLSLGQKRREPLEGFTLEIVVNGLISMRWYSISLKMFHLFSKLSLGEQQHRLRQWRQVCHQEHCRSQQKTVSVCWRKDNLGLCTQWEKVYWMYVLHRSYNSGWLQGEKLTYFYISKNYRVSQKKCPFSPSLSFRSWEGCF